jgi:ribosomal protein S18 acetylase RimI-like enzyme
MVSSNAPSVSLRPMSVDEFAEWRPHSIESFAADLARAMNRPHEVALLRAQAVFDEELSDGLDTPGTWLLMILDDDGTIVGELWLGPHPQRQDAAFVYDIEIHTTSRRRGYGRAAMLAAEQLVRSSGVNELALSVFGFNESAKALYDSIGYRILATQMSKALSG